MADIGSTMPSISNDTIRDYLNYLSAHPNGEEIQYRTPFQTFFEKSVPPHLAKRNITVIQEDRHSGIEVEGTPDFFCVCGLRYTVQNIGRLYRMQKTCLQT